jgi:hypothetical protein
MKNMKKPIVIYCFFCVWFIGYALLPLKAGAELQENEMLAMGAATVVDGNLAQAKENAISQALAKGLENYLLHKLGTEGMANNFQRVIYGVLPEAREKIENFNILAEDETEGEYRVLLRLRINEKLLAKGLEESGVLLSEGPPLKALFLVSEWREERIYHWWEDPEMQPSLSPTELALHRAFQKRGLRPINRTLSVPDTTGLPDSLRSADLEPSGALAWGRLFSADVVLFGKMEILTEREAFLTVKVLDVAQGALISRSMETEKIAGGSEGKRATMRAIDRLANRLAARMTPTIIRYAAADRAKVRQLEVTLSGLSSYRQFRMFRDFLRRDVAGVASVRQTRVRKNAISMAVGFKGDPNAFVERVLRHENLPFSVNLAPAQGEGIFFEVL